MFIRELNAEINFRLEQSFNTSLQVIGDDGQIATLVHVRSNLAKETHDNKKLELLWARLSNAVHAMLEATPVNMGIAAQDLARAKDDYEALLQDIKLQACEAPALAQQDTNSEQVASPVDEDTCISCPEVLCHLDEDPNGEQNIMCARCRAEEDHDFDAEPDATFNRDGTRAD